MDEMTGEAMQATGLTRERVELAFSEAITLDPWGLPDPGDTTDGYASVIHRDDCGCCGSVAIFLVGPAGSYSLTGWSGSL